MTMGSRIKELRLKMGLSQEELGKRVGLQKAAIYKYEAGLVTNLKRSTIAKLSEVLNTSPAYLMGWEEKSNQDIHILDSGNNDMTVFYQLQRSKYFDELRQYMEMYLEDIDRLTPIVDYLNNILEKEGLNNFNDWSFYLDQYNDNVVAKSLVQSLLKQGIIEFKNGEFYSILNRDLLQLKLSQCFLKVLDDIKKK